MYYSGFLKYLQVPRTKNRSVPGFFARSPWLPVYKRGKSCYSFAIKTSCASLSPRGKEHFHEKISACCPGASHGVRHAGQRLPGLRFCPAGRAGRKIAGALLPRRVRLFGGIQQRPQHALPLGERDQGLCRREPDERRPPRAGRLSDGAVVPRTAAARRDAGQRGAGGQRSTMCRSIPWPRMSTPM